MAHVLTAKQIARDNRAFRNTAGVSRNNRRSGFEPAFLDCLTGIIYLSRNPDGSPAICHRLDGLPAAIVLERDADGRARKLKKSVIAGFRREGRFYSREQAAALAEAAK